MGYRDPVTERVASSILEELHVRLAAGARGRTRPFVTLAYAQSLDGSIAGDGNRPLRLSCESSLLLTHELRAAHDAILVGIGTVLADNPRLNVRLVDGKDPRPVVVDSRLRTPKDALLLAGGREVFVATTETAPNDAPVEHATLLRMPSLPNGWVDLDRLLGELSARSVRHVLVEGGARILTTLIHLLEDLDLSRGVASLCIGGGEAVALLIERPSKTESKKSNQKGL